MKEIKLTSIQRDALLFKALIREVFPKPKKGEMFFTPQFTSSSKDNGKYIYLKAEYYVILFEAIKEDEKSGKFSSSNAEEQWIGIINSFNLAKDVHDIDYQNLQEWDL